MIIHSIRRADIIVRSFCLLPCRYKNSVFVVKIYKKSDSNSVKVTKAPKEKIM